MRGSTRFKSADEKLAGILDMAKRQREFLARGDLDALSELQQQRQQLMAGIQSLDNATQEGLRARSEVLRLDKEMETILLAELADIKDKLGISTSLRKLLRTRSSPSKRPSRHLSRRA